MNENWFAKLVAFLIVFALFWALGSWVVAQWQLGFVIGLVAAAAFGGVAIRR